MTIVEGPPEEDLIIRISDSGGGLPDLISQLSTPGAEGLPTPPPPTSSPAIDPFSDPQPTPSWYARGGVGSAGTTSASDPLIDALCSFSTVRRRLDLEAQRDARSEAGLATRDRFDALRSVRRFKGTVTEGTGPAALRGAMRGAGVVARHGLGARRSAQRTRRITTGAVRDLLWPGLPPGMRVLRSSRDRLWRLVGRAPRVPGDAEAATAPRS